MQECDRVKVKGNAKDSPGETHANMRSCVEQISVLGRSQSILRVTAVVAVSETRGFYLHLQAL